MSRKILLTSFQTWLPHQKSNSSDDLLQKMQGFHCPEGEFIYLRYLPVDTVQASAKVIAAIAEYQPDFVICCGMAESRTNLTLESNACFQEGGKTQQILYTSLPLESLVSVLTQTEMSHDAGKFVCEGLYYKVLEYLHFSACSCSALFVHVPVLTPDNEGIILSDFKSLLRAILIQ